jgi:hypothetical protein
MSTVPPAPVSALGRIRAVSRWRKVARLEFPSARIEGSGAWASVSECSTQVVRLHESEELAARAVAWLDRMTCGGRHCQPTDGAGVANHYLVPLAG